MVSSVAPLSPCTRQPARPRRLSFSRSPLTRPTRPSRVALPTGVLTVIKSACVDLNVGPVRRRRRASTTSRSENNKLPITPSKLEQQQQQERLSRTTSMDGLLQCANCGQNFDLERRRPKLLPCGHTLCHACVLGGLRENKVVCPVDQQVVHVDAYRLQDDLQLICWLEATAQGLLECVCCGEPFDWLLRRPAALDCGHAVCRVCLQEASAPPVAPCSPLPLPRSLTRAASIDESWDYSLEDGDADAGDTCSMVSSLSSDEGVALSVGELLVDCPIEGCLKGVRARDHLHLLSCIEDPSQHRAKRAIKSEDQLIEKLNQLEKQIASVYGSGASLEAKSGTKLVGRHDADMSALLASVRQLVEHKSYPFVDFQDSPRSEHPTVLKQVLTVGNCTLPDLLPNKAALRSKEEGIKDFHVELDVYELSLYGPGELRVKKEAALRSEKKVWKLTGVDCWCDPEWTLRLLRLCAPHLEHLQLQYAGREHLQVVRDCMPNLRRLEVRGWCGLDLQRDPFDFDRGSAGRRDTLEWVEAYLPTQTSMSLLRAHRGSLRKLRLVVAEEWTLPTATSTAGSEDHQVVVVDDDVEVHEGREEGEWPEEDGFAVVPFGEECTEDGVGRGGGCWDDLLRECGAAGAVALKAVSLMWLSPRAHDTWSCRRFARAMLDDRPDVRVDCEECRRCGADAASRTNSNTEAHAA